MLGRLIFLIAVQSPPCTALVPLKLVVPSLIFTGPFPPASVHGTITRKISLRNPASK